MTTEVAWIAGVGAQAGLGAASARRFASGGLTVAISGRTAAKVEAVRDAIRSAGGRAEALVGDMSVPEDAQNLAAKVFALGQLKVAVSNAGGWLRATPLETTPQQFEATWRGGTYAGFVFARAALPGLLGAGGATLIFTGATASIKGRGAFVAFAAAKAGLRSVAQSFAREYGPQGLHVAHVVIDGVINGERVRREPSALAEQAGADGLLSPDAIAETYFQLSLQPRSAWTHELDLRPYKESF